MPEYVYRDGRGHQRALAHRMLYSTGVVCDCGLPMHRVPQAPRINWNGDRAAKPLDPRVRHMLADAPRAREEYAKEHAEHEQRTHG